MIIGDYSIIYADPPWQYQRSKVQGAAENHYPTIGIDELCALPVADLAAPDSALFLWATFPQLPEALRLIKAWGFQYKSVAFVWEMRRSACWQQKGIRSGRRPISTSLSFPPLKPTAKSRTRPGKRLLHLWAICPGWSCSQDRRRPAGMCGEMR